MVLLNWEEERNQGLAIAGLVGWRATGEFVPSYVVPHHIGFFKACRLGKISILTGPKRELCLVRFVGEPNGEICHQSLRTVAGLAPLPILFSGL